ncbi:deoxynucleoside kinase [Candidatus Gottesmanbacteria bacterium]|nr:deoxynucleoside kinase [Candidatus Gottesmanbacteria bacterium]
MGSGKTTAAKLIAKELRLHLIEENFGENAFLPRFYAEMKRWAFHSQTFFLMEKINQMIETAKVVTSTAIIQDTPIEQDVFSYAKAQAMLGNMDDDEWRLYQKIYRSFIPLLPKPDCIIYLKASLETVKKRINGRKRQYERRIPDSYLELLETLNDRWLKKETNGIRVIELETDNYNLVRSHKDIVVFLNNIRSQLKHG